MSWSKNVKGAITNVLAAVKGWPDEVAAQDAGSSATEMVQNAHRAQVQSVERALAHVAYHAAHELSVEANGHANTDGTGEVHIHIKHYDAPVSKKRGSKAADTLADPEE